MTNDIERENFIKAWIAIHPGHADGLASQIWDTGGNAAKIWQARAALAQPAATGAVGITAAADELERVARAICEKCHPEDLDEAEINYLWHLYRPEAKAAISALRTAAPSPQASAAGEKDVRAIIARAIIDYEENGLQLEPMMDRIMTALRTAAPSQEN